MTHYTDHEFAALLAANADLTLVTDHGTRTVSKPTPAAELVQLGITSERAPIRITVPDFRVRGWNTIMRMHWTEQDRRNREAWLMVLTATQGCEWRELDYRVDVHVIATFRGNMLDADNICSKFAIDAIKTKRKNGVVIERRILPDDNPQWVRRVTTESLHGKRDRMEIILTEAL